MRTPLHFIVFCSLTLCSTLLPAQNCESTPTAQIDLAGNAVTARITTGGDLWFDGQDGRYLVTEASNSTSRPSAVFAGGLWLAGRDPGGGLKVAAQQYGRSSGRFDYAPGPLTDQGIPFGECEAWDRFWPITSQEVRDYQIAFDPQNPDISVIPNTILGWPGVGNPHFTEVNGFESPLTPQGLAPFWDEDLDGIYDPMNGDYPLFCGDQAVWCVFNDNVLHEESATPSQLQMEVRLLAYSFNTDDEALNQTTFYDYTLINRAQEDLIDFYAGMWIDFDLGCFTDDAFGSIPEDNLVYVHNINEQDTEFCQQGVTSFQTPGVMQIAQVVHSTLAEAPFFRDTLLAAAPFILSDQFDGPPQQLGPTTASEYYNYLQGLWRDGTPITRGGSGYQSGGDVTAYAFDGGSQADGTPWNLCSNDIPSLDRRSVLSTGPYPPFQPGAVMNFTMAMTTLFNVDQDEAGCPDTDAIVIAARTIKDIYDNNCTTSVLSSTDDASSPTPFNLIVYPNPTRQQVTFRTERDRTIGTIEFFDALGRPLLRQEGNSDVLEIDLRSAGLRTGVYLYRHTDREGIITTGKVILRE